jgi:hypothetical protein
MPKEIQKKCPLIGEECWGHECEWYQHIRGLDPQSGEPVDEYKCAHLWQNVLLIENSQMQRQTGAAVESFRNEMTVQNNELARALSGSSRTLLIEEK